MSSAHLLHLFTDVAYSTHSVILMFVPTDYLSGEGRTAGSYNLCGVNTILCEVRFVDYSYSPGP